MKMLLIFLFLTGCVHKEVHTHVNGECETLTEQGAQDIERFHRSIKEECLNWMVLRSKEELKTTVNQ